MSLTDKKRNYIRHPPMGYGKGEMLAAIEVRKALAMKNRREMPNVATLLDQIKKANPGLKYKVIGAEDKITGKKIGRID